MRKRAVAIIKWGKGYPTEQFNRLKRALRDTSGDNFEIVCITDDPTGLDADIRTVPLPDIPLPRDLWNKGMWPKVAYYAEEVFPDGYDVIGIDVDVAVMKDITPVFDSIEEGVYGVVYDWPGRKQRWFGEKRERTGNTSLFAYRSEDQRNLWEEFTANPMQAFETYRLDQAFATLRNKNVRYFPTEWCESFKKVTSPVPPMGMIWQCRPGPDCIVVAFHGKPDIEDLTDQPFLSLKGLAHGHGPVTWLRDYLKKYA